MYTEYQKSRESVWDHLKKIGWFLLAFLAIGGVLSILIIMMNTPSQRVRNAHQKTMERKRNLREKIDTYIEDSGYIRKKVGRKEIYIPALLIQVTNESEEEIERMVLQASFKREDKDICRGTSLVLNLKSQQTRRVNLRCIHFVGFSTMVQGLSLAQTTEKIYYELNINHKGVNIEPEEGELEFKMISPYLRY